MLNSRRWLPVLTLVTGVLIGVASVGLRTGSSLAFVVPPVSGASPAATRPPADASGATTSPKSGPSRAVAHDGRYAAGASSRRDEAMGCRPDEDVSCTIVRETSGGIVVFTRAYRDGSQVAVVPASGAPAVEFGGSGVCVVPGHSVRPLTATSRYPNGAPILE